MILLGGLLLVACGDSASSVEPVAAPTVAAPVSASASTPDPVGPGAPVRVWIDVDVAAGLPHKDVDDAVALVQAFHSAELDVVGVSTVFGNSSLEAGDPIAREVVGLLDPTVSVARGAAQAGASKAPTEAVTAMVAALEAGPLTFLALGPATNVAELLRHHPEAAAQITRVVAVAGRRRGQRFVTGTTNLRGHRDFNFEKDPEAFQVLLHHNVALTLAPWEVSSRVWVTEVELSRLAAGPAPARWLAAAAPSWLQLWKEEFAVDGFNPFDTLAVGVITRPDLFECEEGNITVELAPNDVSAVHTRTEPSKPYLVVGGEVLSEHRASYCHTASAAFLEDLMTRLLTERHP